MVADPPTQPGEINLKWPRPEMALRLLLAVAGFLGLMHVVGPYTGIGYVESHFRLNAEETIPTWWSAIQLFVLSICLLAVAREDPEVPRVKRALGIGAAISMFFSLDEIATLHEPLELLLDRFEWIPRFAGKGHWMTVYAVAGLIAVAFMLPGLRKFWAKRRADSVRFLIGAGLLVSGGIVAELFFYYGTDTVLIEEGLEIIGVSVMIWATLRVLYNSKIRISP